MTAASLAATLLSRKRVVYRLRPADCKLRRTYLPRIPACLVIGVGVTIPGGSARRSQALKYRLFLPCNSNQEP